ncbi:MAG: ribosome maturation factor RimP [Pseudomonadota bacterium]
MNDTEEQTAATPQTPDPSRRFVREVGIARQVAEMVEPIIEGLGFRLVRVMQSGRDGGTVQIMADAAEREITVEDCAEISRTISPLLDTYDPIPGSYQLEVSSPGIDRPLVRPSDFEDWAGYEIKLEVRELVDGRKRFRGVLEGFDEENRGEVRLRTDLENGDGETTLGFPMALVESAKLMMTDDLIAEALKRQKKLGRVGDADAT